MARSRVLFASLLLASALLALVGVFVMTDLGQLFSIQKSVIVSYFQANVAYMIGATLLFVFAALLNRREKILRRRWLVVFGVFLLGCFVSTKYAAPYLMFPTQQHDAVYKTIEEAEGYLADDDTVYVVDRNGVARAYPQRYIWQPHVFGAEFGEERVVLTYCVLSNLPIAYHEELDGESMNLRVLAQTNNNLLLWDTNGGEIIQQINSTAEFSKRRLEPLPVLEMSWKAFQTLYPGGTVLFNEFDNPIEIFLDFAQPIEDAHGGDEYMFKSVATDDTRLPPKAQVIGIESDGESVAYTRDYLRKAGLTNVRVGDKSLVIAHIPEHDMFVAFDRMKDGVEIEVSKVDAFGRTPEHGQLNRAFIFNGVLWAVWLHYYPDTELKQ